MEYAIAQGKEVAIISDMYLPSEIITDILNSLGIKGYTKLYVSCDYGVSKCNCLRSEENTSELHSQYLI